MEKPHFVFREPESLNELKSLLRLRYKVYRGSRLEKFCSENEAGIDLDCYDLHSRHFGLFKNDQNKTQPVGYIRVVEDSNSTMQQEIVRLAKEFPRICEKINITSRAPFPVMAYCPDANLLWELYKSIKTRSQKIVELSRLVIDPSFRSSGLSQFLFQSTAALCVQTYSYNYALLCCDRNYRKFYSRIGFSQVTGINDFFVYGLPSCCLMASAESVSRAYHEKLLRLAEAFRESGCICYYPYTWNWLYSSSNIHKNNLLASRVAA